MKTYLSLILGALCALVQPACAQTQPNYAAQITAAGPSLRLNFNDASFVDQVSGLAFNRSDVPNVPTPQDMWLLDSNSGAGADSIGSNTLTIGAGSYAGHGDGGFTGYYVYDNSSTSTTPTAVAANTTSNPAPTAAFHYSLWWSAASHTLPYSAQSLLLSDRSSGNLQGFALGFNTDGTLFAAFCNSGCTTLLYEAAATGSSDNTHPHLIAVDYDGSGHAAGLKLFFDGALLTAGTTVDTLAGATATTSTPIAIGGTAGTTNSEPFGAVIADVRYATVAYTAGQEATLFANGFRVTGTSGTVTPSQPGFDPLTYTNNKSTGFNAAAYLYAPNSTLGAYEWNQAFTIHLTVEGLTSTPALLATHGSNSDLYNGLGWRVYWTGSLICLQINTHGSSNTVSNPCTIAMPTGYPLDIWITHDGTGRTFLGDAIYINGQPETNTAAFPTSTTVPTGSTMLDSSVLYIAGDSAARTGSGASIQMDEFDMFPGVVSLDTIYSSFVHLHFFLQILGTKPAVPQKVIFSNDSCQDPDNEYAFELTIMAHRLGYIKLMAVTETDTAGGSIAFWRALLDDAGLHHIPVLRTAEALPVQASDTICHSSTILPTYNSSIDTTWADYPVATNVYRQIMAGLASGEKLTIFNAGHYVDLSDFLQSPADGISSLTGAQLWAQSVNAVLLQGGVPPPVSTGVTGDNGLMDWAAAEYLSNNNGTVPLRWYGGTPSGPIGSLHTRPHTDPLWEMENINNSDSRQCWDCLPATNFMTTAFADVSSVAEGQMTFTSAPTISETVSTTSNQFFYPLSTLETAYNQLIFQWFTSSIANQTSKGFPRGGY